MIVFDETPATAGMLVPRYPISQPRLEFTLDAVIALLTSGGVFIPVVNGIWYVGSKNRISYLSPAVETLAIDILPFMGLNDMSNMGAGDIAGFLNSLSGESFLM